MGGCLSKKKLNFYTNDHYDDETSVDYTSYENDLTTKDNYFPTHLSHNSSSPKTNSTPNPTPNSTPNSTPNITPNPTPNHTPNHTPISSPTLTTGRSPTRSGKFTLPAQNYGTQPFHHNFKRVPIKVRHVRYYENYSNTQGVVFEK